MSCRIDSIIAAPVASLCTEPTTAPDALAAEQAAAIIADLRAAYRRFLSQREAPFALTALANKRIPLTQRGEREGDPSEMAHKYLPSIEEAGPATSAGQWEVRDASARYALRVAEVAMREADTPGNPFLMFLLAAALCCDEEQTDAIED